MSKLNDEQIRKLLCAAINSKILIVTVNDDTANTIKTSIVDYIKSRGLGAVLSDYRQHGWIYFTGGYEDIAVMSAAWWAKKAKLDFKGLVLITNRQITDIPHILQQPQLLTNFLLEG